MKKLHVIGLAMLALAIGVFPASAQQQQQQQPQRLPEHKAGDLPGPIDNLQDLQDTGRLVFHAVDMNNDGQISQKEAVDAGNLVAGGFFFRADQNGDGVLSKDEARQAREAFLSTKPWLRYALETGKAQVEKDRQKGDTKVETQNPVETIFSAFDTNNDGKLQASELRQVIQTAVQSEFAVADTNRDGQLSPSEVNAAIAGLGRQMAQTAFQKADTDNDGQISEAEFEKALREPIRVAFSVADLNHDGKISQQEAQTARQVLASKLRSMALPEPANSPRNQINRTLGNSSQPGQSSQTPAPPSPPR